MKKEPVLRLTKSIVGLEPGIYFLVENEPDSAEVALSLAKKDKRGKFTKTGEFFKIDRRYMTPELFKPAL